MLIRIPEQTVASNKILARRYIAWALLASCYPELALEQLQKVSEIQ